MYIDPDRIDKAAAYRLLISLLIPRPIAWVGSRSAPETGGIDNLAPFSFFMGVCAEPPMIAISVARGREGRLKDTARNILQTGVFSVSMVERPHLEPMHRTGADWPGPEFDAVGVPRAPCARVACPRVADARVALECTLHQATDLDAAHLIVGRVVAFHIDDALYKDGAVDLSGYQPVARLGGASYATLGEIIDLPRVRL